MLKNFLVETLAQEDIKMVYRFILMPSTLPSSPSGPSSSPCQHTVGPLTLQAPLLEPSHPSFLLSPCLLSHTTVQPALCIRGTAQAPAEFRLAGLYRKTRAELGMNLGGRSWAHALSHQLFL